MVSEKILNLTRLTVAKLYPDDFGRGSKENAHIAEIDVFSNDCIPVRSRKVLDVTVWLRAEPQALDMFCCWKDIGKACNQSRR